MVNKLGKKCSISLIQLLTLIDQKKHFNIFQFKYLTIQLCLIFITFHPIKQNMKGKTQVLGLSNRNIRCLIKKRLSEDKQSLDLEKCPQDWAQVLKFQQWSQLKLLVLNQCGINDSNIGTIAEVEWPSLERIRLWQNKISQKGIEKLLRNAWPKLSTIAFYKNRIGDEGLEMVLKKQGDRLKTLGVCNNLITFKGIGLFLSYNVSTLTQLNISQNKIYSTGIKLLTKVNLPVLELLWLQDCFIGEEGIKHLLKAKWDNLIDLNISVNQAGINGKLSFGINNWSKLENLQLWQQDPQTKQMRTKVIPSLHLVLGEQKQLKIETGFINLQLENIFVQSIFKNRFYSQAQ